VSGAPVAASSEHRSARRPWAFVRDNPIAFALLAVAVLSAVFLVFPEADLWFSEIFHRARGGFWLRRNAILGGFRAVNDVLLVAVFVLLIAAVALKIGRPEKPSLIRPSVVVFLLSTAIAGPLLLVNVLLKGTWGRPRPIQVDVFGGDAPYVEVWRITDWCPSNCSFVSGEASSAIWLVAVALVLPARFRTPALAAAVTLALLLSLNRIAFGGHFLSDVLIAFGLTLLVIAVLYRIVIARPPAWLTDAALEAGLTQIGRRIRRRFRTTGTA